MTLDPAALPYIPARHYHASRTRPIRLIVVHTPETPETATVAENVARYFQTTDRKASTHTVVDNDSGVRCVLDHHTAFGAAGANADGLHIEVAGRARQTAGEWADTYSQDTLANGADVIADWCRRWDIPARRLSVAQVRDGVTKGICGHRDVEAAFPSSGHSDPGVEFPWPGLLRAVDIRLRLPSEVRPMFDPPIPIAAPIAAELFPEWEGRILGHYQLTVEGHIYAWGVLKSHGWPAGKPYWVDHGATAVRLELTWTGYDVIDQHNHRYSYPET